MTLQETIRRIEYIYDNTANELRGLVKDFRYSITDAQPHGDIERQRLVVSAREDVTALSNALEALRAISRNTERTSRDARL